MGNLKDKTLLLFGDSIMNGSGNGDIGVGEYLVEHKGVLLKKYCVGGARVGFCEGKNWLVEQVKEVIASDVRGDYIVFDGFTNDCYMPDGKTCDVPLGEVRAEVKDIFDITKEDSFTTCFESIAAAFSKHFPSAKCLFVRPHKMGRRDAIAQKVYGERAVSICKRCGIAVADVYTDTDMDTFNPECRDKYTADTYGWGRGDCTHPNAAGYSQKYMPLIERALEEL